LLKTIFWETDYIEPKSGLKGLYIRFLLRSIFWETEYIEPKSGFYQDAWVVNHPDMSVGKNFYFLFFVDSVF